VPGVADEHHATLVRGAFEKHPLEPHVVDRRRIDDALADLIPRPVDTVAALGERRDR
jgi:hypothetical protein